MSGKKSEFVKSSNLKAFANQIATDPAQAGTQAAIIKAGVDITGGSGGIIYWNSSGVPLPTTSGVQTNGVLDLAHEMFHGLDANRGLLDERAHLDPRVTRSEWQAVYRENITRKQLGMSLRTHYIKEIDSGGNILGGAGPRMLTPANQPFRPSWYKK